VRRFVVSATLLACAFGCASGSALRLPDLAAGSPPVLDGASRGLPRAPATSVRARVVRVTDGDTIVLTGISDGEIQLATGGRKARLIGIDTPEVYGGVECYGRAASDFTDRELLGTTVRVAFDVGRTDRYGRALVYVWDDHGRFFNARLVREGYAMQETVPPNVRYASLFTRLVREARTAKRGLWSAC